jgi:hypothetical protein
MPLQCWLTMRRATGVGTIGVAVTATAAARARTAAGAAVRLMQRVKIPRIMNTGAISRAPEVATPSEASPGRAAMVTLEDIVDHGAMSEATKAVLANVDLNLLCRSKCTFVGAGVAQPRYLNTVLWCIR